MLKVLIAPNKILITPSIPIKKIDSKVKKLAKDMILLLKKGAKGKPFGVGLSACQVGQLLRISIAYSKKSRQYLTFINPKILWRSKRKMLGVPERENSLEGCLSIPGVWGKVWRHKKIKVSYQTLKGTPVVRKFDGFLSVVVQHEYDHLNGILFIQRVLEQKGNLYKIEKDKEGKESLVKLQI